MGGSGYGAGAAKRLSWRTGSHTGSYTNVYAQRGREARGLREGHDRRSSALGGEETWLNRNVAEGATTARLLSLQYMNFLVWLPHAA